MVIHHSWWRLSKEELCTYIWAESQRGDGRWWPFFLGWAPTPQEAVSAPPTGKRRDWRNQKKLAQNWGCAHSFKKKFTLPLFPFIGSMWSALTLTYLSMGLSSRCQWCSTRKVPIVFLSLYPLDTSNRLSKTLPSCVDGWDMSSGLFREFDFILFQQ